jgi:peptidoglycan LD-endopeptidase CwlK
MTLSEISLKRLDQCDDRLKKLIIRAAEESPISFQISTGYRSPEEQYELYKQGRTKTGSIVTYKDGFREKSKHNFLPSQAIDVVCMIDNKVTWASSVYIKLSEHILKVAKELNIPIEWGGNFKTLKDYPHYQI